MCGRRYVVFVIVFVLWLGHGMTSPNRRYYNKEDATGYDEFFDEFFTVELNNMTQSVRKSLKTMRKWYHSHPTEVRLGKCLAHYFNIKIPGLKRVESSLPVYIDEDNFVKLQEWRSSKFLKGNKSESKRVLGRKPRSYSLITHENWIENIKSVLKSQMEVFIENIKFYHDEIINNPVIVCTWNYLITKFWHWVDTAPID